MIPKGDTTGADGKVLFNRSAFKYDREQDIYICPTGQELQNRFTVMEDGLEQDMYFNNIACSNCSSRAKCTTANYKKASGQTKEPCKLLVVPVVINHPLQAQESSTTLSRSCSR